MAIEELQNNIQTLEERRSALKEEAFKELEADNLEKAKELRSEIGQIDQELTEKRSELEAAEQPEEKDEAPLEPEQEEKIEEHKEEKRSMEDIRTIVEENKGPSLELEGFRHYLMTGEARDVTTSSDGIVVPEEIATDVINLTDAMVSLDKYVRVKNVTNKRGSQPVLNAAEDNTPLPSVEELQANPKLAVQALSNLDYDIQTYRGYIPISREALEDSTNAEEVVRQVLANKVIATRNAHILAVLNALPATPVDSADGLKAILNTQIKPKYNKLLIMSQSAYNAIDTLKDGNGRYLLQDSITASSGKVLFGKEVVVFEDELIGADTIFAGDPASAVVLFNRSQYQAKWTDYMHFGECLMVAVRHDVRPLSTDAVVRITFTTAPAGV